MEMTADTFRQWADLYRNPVGTFMGTVHDEEWAWLLERSSNVTSQAGEDGVIAAVFEQIGTENKCCFEVGAHDGKFVSNTMQWRDAGWRALLIEADAGLYEQLKEYQSESVDCLHCRICEGRKLDAILARFSMPTDMDLGIIDIDGQDYWAWTDMETYRPRVMMIEFSTPTLGGGVIPKRGDEGDGAGSVQAPESDILELGKSKGYLPLVSVGVNAIFIAEEVL